MCQGTWRRSVAKPWLFRPLGGTRGLSSISDLIACKHDWLNIGGLGSSLTLIAGACSRSPGHPAASSSCPQDRGLTTGPTKVSFAHCQAMQLTRPCLSMALKIRDGLGPLRAPQSLQPRNTHSFIDIACYSTTTSSPAYSSSSTLLLWCSRLLTIESALTRRKHRLILDRIGLSNPSRLHSSVAICAAP